MIEIRSKITDGKITRNRKLLIDAIASHEGKEVIITVKRAKKQRTNPQNAFYWGCCLPIMQQALKNAGHLMNVTDVHELLKLRFLKETIVLNDDGEYMERVKSTTELSTVAFEEYLDSIRQFAAEYFNTVIGYPNEEVTLNFDA